MPDQAAGLRGLFARRRPSLVVVAGNDAAKARIAVRLARDAAAGGRATVLVDATPGRVAAACASACRYELSNVVAGDVAFADVVRVLSPHLLLLPAARAIARFDRFSADEHARVAAALSGGIAEALAAHDVQSRVDSSVADQADAQVDAQVDLIVVHAEDGQALRAVDAFGRDARIVIVASQHEPSLRGAYAEMKALAQAGLEHFEIVAPRGDGVGADAAIVFANLAATARRFLEIDLVDGGVVDLDAPTSSPASPHPSPNEEEVPHAAAA